MPPSKRHESAPPVAFEAWDEVAAYADGSLTRSQAITEGRDACWQLRDDYLRTELRAVRVYMRRLVGEEAEEFFEEEDMSGWIEVPRHLITNGAQLAKLTPMWRVEPAPARGQEREQGR